MNVELQVVSETGTDISIEARNRQCPVRSGMRTTRALRVRIVVIMGRKEDTRLRVNTTDTLHHRTFDSSTWQATVGVSEQAIHVTVLLAPRVMRITTLRRRGRPAVSVACAGSVRGRPGASDTSGHWRSQGTTRDINYAPEIAVPRNNYSLARIYVSKGRATHVNMHQAHHGIIQTLQWHLSSHPSSTVRQLAG